MAPGRGVWVNVPFGISQRQVEKFVIEKKDWILQNHVKIQTYEKDTGVGLQIGAEVKTKLHTLRIEETEGIKPGYKLEGELIRLLIPCGTEYKKIERIVEKFLVEIYKMESRQYLPKRVQFYAAKCGFKYSDLSFRNNISNWGSCSYDNNISLNVKLMKLPDDVIDYVILHELCHTVEKNHSASFWQLVKKVCPDYEGRRHKLRNYNTRI